MSQDPNFSPFLCPECGNTENSKPAITYRSTIYNPDVPWSAIDATSGCSKCSYQIPSHLAYPGSDLTAEEAKQEWQESYRIDAPKN